MQLEDGANGTSCLKILELGTSGMHATTAAAGPDGATARWLKHGSYRDQLFFIRALWLQAAGCRNGMHQGIAVSAQLSDLKALGSLQLLQCPS